MILTYDPGEFDAMLGVVETYTVSRLDGEYFIIDDSMGTYVRHGTLEEICAKLGVDYSIPN